MALQAQYFDGATSRSREVALSCSVQGVTLSDTSGQLRSEAWNAVEVSERTRHAPRRILFADGAYVQALDAAAFDAAVAQSGRYDGWVVRWQQHWGRTLAALVLIIGVLVAGYVWGLPAFARAATPLVPETVQRTIGEQALKAVDSVMFAPSKLPPERQKALADAFAIAVKANNSRTGPAPQYTLLFRKSKIGPNAFALPGGFVVLTDELVAIAPSDAAVLGVLGHELGHLHHHHVMQRLISTSVIGSVTVLIFGDASTFVAGAVAALLDANYSREAETEADQYALSFMRAAGLPPAEMAAMFRALQKARIDQARGKDAQTQTPAPQPRPDLDEGDRAAGYFDSHPPTEERVRMFEGG